MPKLYDGKTSPPNSQPENNKPPVSFQSSQIPAIAVEAPSVLSTSAILIAATTKTELKESQSSQVPLPSPVKAPAVSIPSPVKTPVVSVPHVTVSQPTTTTTSQPTAAPPKPKTQQRYKHNKMLPTMAMRNAAKKT